MDKNGKFWKKVVSKQKKLGFESDSSESEKEVPLSRTNCNQRQNCCCDCTNCPESQKSTSQKASCKPNNFSKNKFSNSSCLTLPFKDQIEIKILNQEMDEQVSYDKHNILKKQIQDLSTLIRSMTTYVHSLDIRYRTADRLQKLCHEIIPEDLNIHKKKNSTLGSFPKKIKEILQACYTNTELPPNYYEECNEYNNKYKEHSEASLNFYYLLQKVKMPQSEMQELDMEYNKIKDEFNKSKLSISSHLNNIICQQSDVIQTCVQSLLPLLRETMNQDKDIYSILHALSPEVLTRKSDKVISTDCLLNISSKSARRSESVLKCRNTNSNHNCKEDRADDYC